MIFVVICEPNTICITTETAEYSLIRINNLFFTLNIFSQTKM